MRRSYDWFTPTMGIHIRRRNIKLYIKPTPPNPAASPLAMCVSFCCRRSHNWLHNWNSYNPIRQSNIYLYIYTFLWKLLIYPHPLPPPHIQPPGQWYPSDYCQVCTKYEIRSTCFIYIYMYIYIYIHIIKYGVTRTNQPLAYGDRIILFQQSKVTWLSTWCWLCRMVSLDRIVLYQCNQTNQWPERPHFVCPVSLLTSCDGKYY